MREMKNERKSVEVWHVRPASSILLSPAVSQIGETLRLKYVHVAPFSRSPSMNRLPFCSRSSCSLSAYKRQGDSSYRCSHSSGDLCRSIVLWVLLPLPRLRRRTSCGFQSLERVHGGTEKHTSRGYCTEIDYGIVELLEVR